MLNNNDAKPKMKGSLKFEKIILHVGSDKTGSTSIQKVFNVLRGELLDKRKVAYPPSRLMTAIGGAFFEEPEDYILFRETGVHSKAQAIIESEKALTQLEDWLESILSCEILLFSYEGYVTMPEKALRKFGSFLKKYSTTIEIVYYARPPLSYCVSAMSQSVKTGRNPFLGLPVVDHEKNILKLERAFNKKNINVRKFKRESMREGNVVLDFFDALNLPKDYATKLPVFCKENTSLSRAAFYIGLNIISSLEKKGVLKLYYPAVFFQAFGKSLSQISSIDKIKLTPKNISNVLDRSKQGNSFLLSNYGLDLKEDERFFLELLPHENLQYLDTATDFYLDKILNTNDYRGKILIDQQKIPPVLCSSDIFIDGSIINKSEKIWFPLNDDGVINISYRWRDTYKKEIKAGALLRTAINKTAFFSNETYRFRLKVRAPEKSGSYILEILPVKEGVCWLDKSGFSTTEMLLKVV